MTARTRSHAATQGQAAVPVGGGRARPDNEETTHRATDQRPGAAGVTGTGGTCRGAGGRCQDHLQPNFACNSPRHDPTQAQKPQNINDQISKPEILSGELHAKLMIDSQDWATDSNPGPGCGARGRWRGLAGLRDRPLRAAGSRVAISRAGRRPRAHQAARPRQRIQKRPPGTGWAHLSRLWESNPRPIHYE